MFIAILRDRLPTLAIAALPMFAASLATGLGAMENRVGTGQGERLHLAPEGLVADTIRSAPESTADTTENPTDVARSFWNAWARSDTTVMRRLSTGLVAFTPGARARTDSVIVEEPGAARPGQGRTVVPTRLGMSAGSSSFETAFETTLVGGEGRWRVEQLETSQALSLAYIEVMAEQLQRAGDALEEMREDTTKRRS